MTLTEGGKNQWMPVFIYFLPPQSIQVTHPLSSNSLLDKGLQSLIISLTEKKTAIKQENFIYLLLDNLVYISPFMGTKAAQTERYGQLHIKEFHFCIFAQGNACWLV